MALSCFLACGTSEDSEGTTIKFTKPCFNEDELLNLCTDPIETCHEDRGHEIKLVRLDGVKVSLLTKGFTTTYMLNRPSTYNQKLQRMSNHHSIPVV